MDSTLAILIVVILVSIILLTLVLFASFFRSAPVCLNCRRQQVSGQRLCPFCGFPYQQFDPSPASREQASQSAVMRRQQEPRLIGLQGPSAGAEYLLRQPVESIGRASDNTIVPSGMLVSRHHAQVYRRDVQFFVRDLESTNGILVNGRRVVERALQSGDRIQIGENVFVFQIGAAPAPRVVSPPLATPPPAPLPSSVGRDLKTYRIVSTLGVGGAATVYKGISLVDQTPVAIKVLHESDPLIREKFEQEGQIEQQLDHPHIVRIFHYGDEQGTLYIVMEYIDGGSLRVRLSQKPVPLDFITTVIGQTCEALEYAHQRGVIHRDIKPENIMLSTTSGVKMVDFGIAKLTTASTKTSDGVLIGTPYYMSYEQAAGLPVTPASDIYSLGIVLYEMVTGDWPFKGAPLAVIHKHLTEAPTPPRQINPAVSPQLETVVMRALDKNAKRRYQNAMQLANDLGYQRGMQMTVSPVDGLTTMPPQTLPPGIGVSSRSISPLQRGSGARLIVLSGNSKGKQIPLGAGGTMLGRGDIDMGDTVISRRHFQITLQGGRYLLEDAGSANGTFVNGEKIRAGVWLQPGTIIQVGQTMLRFEN